MIHPDLKQSRRRRRPPGPAGGFTLVEMLIVISVIIILLSLLIVGLNKATRASQGAHTQALLQSISQALTRFKEDIGYYPPILDNDRVLRSGPLPWDSNYARAAQQWYSKTSLAEYLIGYDGHNRDGYGYVPDKPAAFDWDAEQPWVGIRHPGPDGVWGAGPDGPLVDRMLGPDGLPGSELNTWPIDRGKVFGPYLRIDDERLLGEMQPDGTIVFPGNPKFCGCYARVICDYWGEPIQYYRPSYPPNAPTQAFRSGVDYNGDGDVDPVPTLSDVICLRPYALDPGGATDNPRIPDGYGDTSTTFELKSAAFALFSKGPDRRYDDPSTMSGVERMPYRVDRENEYNADNIVEVGP